MERVFKIGDIVRLHGTLRADNEIYVITENIDNCSYTGKCLKSITHPPKEGTSANIYYSTMSFVLNCPEYFKQKS